MAGLANAQQHAWLYALLIEIDGYCRNEKLGAVSEDIARVLAKLEQVVYPPLSELGSAGAAQRAVQSAQVIPFPKA